MSQCSSFPQPPCHSEETCQKTKGLLDPGDINIEEINSDDDDPEVVLPSLKEMINMSRIV